MLHQANPRQVNLGQALTESTLWQGFNPHLWDCHLCDTLLWQVSSPCLWKGNENLPSTDFKPTVVISSAWLTWHNAGHQFYPLTLHQYLHDFENSYKLILWPSCSFWKFQDSFKSKATLQSGLLEPLFTISPACPFSNELESCPTSFQTLTAQIFKYRIYL